LRSFKTDADRHIWSSNAPSGGPLEEPFEKEEGAEVEQTESDGVHWDVLGRGWLSVFNLRVDDNFSAKYLRLSAKLFRSVRMLWSVTEWPLDSSPDSTSILHSKSARGVRRRAQRRDGTIAVCS
uniref:Pecanex-like protein n=1 Tax=Anisakis simplex TaxID=6269 RepID=A0A0M3JNZ4_ANISI